MLGQKAVLEIARASFAAAGPLLVSPPIRRRRAEWLAYKGRPAAKPAQPAKAPAPKPKETQAPAPAAPKPEPRPQEPAKKGH